MTDAAPAMRRTEAASERVEPVVLAFHYILHQHLLKQLFFLYFELSNHFELF